MGSKKKQKSTKKKKQKSYIKTNIINTIILLLAISTIAFAIYKITQLVIKPTDAIMIEQGVVTSEEQVTGYIIREETLVKGDNIKNNIIPIKVEGEKIAKGEVLFRYNSNNEEALQSKIAELDIKIQEALDGKMDKLSSIDIKSLDNQIESKIESLKLKNNIQEIAEYKKEINKYITKKAKIAGDLSPAGSYINELISQKTKYENEIYSGSEYITAKKSGVISYRIDNLEDVLTVKSMEKLNKKTLEDLNIKTGQMIASSENTGKIVNNFVCYIATNVKSEEAKEVKVGKKVKLRLSIGSEITATIQSIKEDEDGSLFIVFKTTDYVEKLIDYRKISLDIIWWEYEGLRVPNSAIIYDNSLSYVVRNRAGYLDKILVKILKENANYCIVDNYEPEELKELNYTLTQINSMKKISMYDEIVLTPNIEKLD